MAEGLAFALFSKVSNAAVKKEKKRRQLLKERPMYHRRSAPSGQRRPSGERRRILSSSEDIERIAASRIVSSSSSPGMDSSSGRHNLLSRRSGSPASGESSEDEDAQGGLVDMQMTPIDNGDVTVPLIESNGILDANGIGLRFEPQLQTRFVSIRITFMTPDSKDAVEKEPIKGRCGKRTDREVHDVRICSDSSRNEGPSRPDASSGVFRYRATIEDLSLYCAEKARVPSRYFPIFALYSPDLKLWLPPDCHVAGLASHLETDFIYLEFRVRLAIRPPPTALSRDDRSSTLNYVDVSKDSDVVREYVYHQLKEDFVDGKLVGNSDSEDDDHGDRTTLCDVVTSKHRTTKREKTSSRSDIDIRYDCLPAATFSLYHDKPPGMTVKDYLPMLDNKTIDKHLPPCKTFPAKALWKFAKLGLNGPNPIDLIRKGFKKHIEDHVQIQRSQLQLQYILKIMTMSKPFEERFICHSPPVGSNSASDLDDGDDEEDAEIVVKLKQGDAFPIVIYNKEEIAVSDILRIEVFANRVELMLNPRVISMAFEKPLCAESFAALINTYAMLSPRPDRFFALCFRGSPGSSRYFHSLDAVKCLMAEVKNELSFLFQASDYDDPFLVIEDKDQVGCLHIHRLKRIAENPTKARVEVAATLVYLPHVGHWRCIIEPDRDLYDSELRSILNKVVKDLKEKGKNCQNIAPSRKAHRLSTMYAGPPSSVTSGAGVGSKTFFKHEISGGTPINGRPSYMKKFITWDNHPRQEVVVKVDINKDDVSRVQRITEWSLSRRCPETLLRTYGHCLDPLSLVLEVAAAKSPLDRWMTRLSAESLRKVCEEKGEESAERRVNGAEAHILAPLTTSICDQVGRALQFLASHEIPHGYVAASNVLVVSSNESEYENYAEPRSFVPDIRVKLGDPVFMSLNWEERIAHTPPDLWDFKSEGWNKNSTLLAADVWAYGTFMWEVFSFCKMSIPSALPDTVRTKSEVEDFLRNNRLPQPMPPTNDDRDIWERAYKIMEQCWTSDVHSRPRMSVIFEAQWQFLNGRDPEDMKHFESFIINNQEPQGAPIPFGDFGLYENKNDGIIDICNDVEPVSRLRLRVPGPGGKSRDFEQIRQSSGQVLGRGYFGEVFRGVIKFSKDDVRQCAVKTFGRNTNADGDQIMKEDEIEKEMQIGLNIPLHENIIELIGVYKDVRYATQTHLIIMELMEVSLEKHLGKVKSEKDWDYRRQKHILSQISRGMAHLHEHNILHRDLAVRNVMLKNISEASPLVKVGDFGLSRLTEKHYYARNDRSTAIPVYMYPPETLKSDDFKYFPEGDVWSFGQLALEVCSPRHPTSMRKEFDNIGGKDGVKKGNSFPQLDCSAPVYEGLVRRCMEYDRLERPLFHDDGSGRPTIKDLIETVMSPAKS